MFSIVAKGIERLKNAEDAIKSTSAFEFISHFFLSLLYHSKIKMENWISQYDWYNIPNKFIWMFDKNRKKIYEGSLVKLRHKNTPAICVIVYNNASGYYCLKRRDGYINPYMLNDGSSYEVVGTIQENEKIFLEQKQF